MFNKKSHSGTAHIMIGIIAIVSMLYIYNSYKPTMFDYLPLILIAAIYSLLPDIDQPGSKINLYFTLLMGGVVLAAFAKYIEQFYGIMAIITLVVVRLIHHREAIHTFIAGIVISLPLMYLGPLYFAVGLIAYSIHLISENEFNIGFEKDWRVW